MWHQHVDHLRDGGAHPLVINGNYLDKEMFELEDGVNLQELSDSSVDTAKDQNTNLAVS